MTNQGARRAEFEAFVRREQPGLLAYGVVLTGDAELARDLVQDALVKAFERWPRIRAMEHPRAYVRTAITRGYLSWRRRWSVRQIAVVDELHPPPIPDHANAVAEQDDVRRRLDSLPRQQRAVLVLRYYERLTDTEAAEVLGCSVGTVRGYVSRALTTLRLAADPTEQSGGSTPERACRITSASYFLEES